MRSRSGGGLQPPPPAPGGSRPPPRPTAPPPRRRKSRSRRRVSRATGRTCGPGMRGARVGNPPSHSWSPPCGARAGEGPGGRSQPPPRAALSRPRSHSSREGGCARTRSESSLSRLPASRPVPSRPGVPGPQSLRPRLRLGAFLGFPRCLSPCRSLPPDLTPCGPSVSSCGSLFLPSLRVLAPCSGFSSLGLPDLSP